MKQPPTRIDTAAGALDAFRRYRDARNRSDNAAARAMRYTAGTATARKLSETAQAFTEHADAWGDALEAYLIIDAAAELETL